MRVGGRVLSGVALLCAGIAIGMIGMLLRPALPMVVTYTPTTTAPAAGDAQASPASQTAKTASPQRRERCAFVGSHRSTKYYPPSCAFARRIAPRNLRCFLSEEDAQSQGYVRAKGC